MTTARYPQVTDELLSAYIDDAVTDAERRLVESAVAEDVEIAWRLESLRTTVRLLRELPALVLPRSFVLTPEQLGQIAAATALAGSTSAPVDSRPTVTPPGASSTGFWTQLAAGWRTFWQAGNPALRNAMAASFAALLVLLAAPGVLAPPALPMAATTVNTAAQSAAPVLELAEVPTRALDARQVGTTAPAPEAAAQPAEAAESAAPSVMSAPMADEAAAAGEEAAPTMADAVEEEAALAQPAGESGADAAKQAAPAPVTADSLATAPGDGSAAAERPAASSGMTLSAGPRDVLAEAAAMAPPAAGPPSLASAAAEAEGDVAAALAMPEAAAPPPPVAAMADGSDTAPMIAPEEPVLDAAAMSAASTTMVEPTVASAEAAMPAPAATAVPTVQPAAQPATPTAAMVAANDRAREMNPVASPAAAVPSTPAMFIPLAQLVAAFAVAAFGLLWWRSRRR